MNILTGRRRVFSVAGAFVAMIVVIAGAWYFLARDTGPAKPTSPALPSSSATATPPATTSPATMTVKVFFHKGDVTDPEQVVAVERTVPKSDMVATAALNELLAGPTAAERDARYHSFFSDATAGMLCSVRIGNGVGHADFRDFSRVIPNASSSTGTAMLLAELNATLKQFGNVTSTVYSFNGDVAAFYQWLQLSPPVGEPPAPQEAVAVASDLLARFAGMTALSNNPVGSIGSGFVAVDFSPAAGEDGKPMTNTVTTVLMQRTASSRSR